MLAKLLLASAALLTTAAMAGPLPLAEAQLDARGTAKVDWRKNAFGLRFDDPHHDSGVRILPPAGSDHWDFSEGRAVSLDIKNLSRDRQLRITVHLSSGEAGTKAFAMVNGGIALNPGEKRTVRVHIPHRAIYDSPEGVPGPRTIDSSRVNWIALDMQWPFEGAAPGLVDCEVSNLRIEGAADTAAAVPAEKFFPFIDRYGQYVHGDWPEKIRSDADLVKAREREAAALAKVRRPSAWNRFGGWAKGPQLEATGYFRTEKYQGKWWLVDPEGRLFFSHGLDVLQASTDATKTTRHERWFDFPVKTTEAPFNAWNLEIKYGTKDYGPAYYQTLADRMDAWGFNTVGNWSRSELMSLRRAPYAMQLTDYDYALPRIAGGKIKFYDVFDPAYVKAMADLIPNAIKKNPFVEESLTDPWCIGYFIDNELNYGNRGRQIFGDIVLKSPAKQAAKREFVRDLRAKYDTIEKLNASWKTDYAGWDALLERTDVPESKGYKADSNVFFEKAVDQYFRLCRDAIKSRAPHRLYLGSRFISTDAVRPALFKASKQYCDVLTVNVYAHSVANLGVGVDFPDMPVIIGEFHFGILDRGMFAPGLVPTGITQKERALAYTRFLQGALANPNIVGAHWFQYRDQPLTGRWDGEGYQIGFVDVADTPYEELAKASREIGEKMYRYRLRGKLRNRM